MGLDQNWMFTEEQGEVDRSSDSLQPLAYFHKFNALEGFMQDVWYREGNNNEFNCELLAITPEIMDELDDRIAEDRLDPLAGFFFGSTEKDEDYYTDLEHLKDEVIPKARKLLEEDKQVFYTSSW